MLAPQELLNHIRLHLHENPQGIQEHLAELPEPDVADLLNHLTLAEAATVIALLPVPRAGKVCNQPTLRRRSVLFEQLDPALAAQLLEHLAADQRRVVLKRMSPHERHRMLPMLPAAIRSEAEQLLRYPDRTAGGIMTTEFIRLNPRMTVGQALKHIRAVARDRETIYACYVLDPSNGHLLGAVSLRDLVMADLAAPVTEIMQVKPITVHVGEGRKSVAQKIGKYNLLAVPVLEDDGRVVGFVTVDDVIDVIIEEQTDTVMRMGAVEPGAPDLPYMATPFRTMIKRRATWLVVLFLSEMLTATAMGFFEGEIAKAVVLALFVPLIISSGGNCGSQAATLVIRALALGEVNLRDWWRIMRREVYSGLTLGAILGSIGFLRIFVWTFFTNVYGPHWFKIGLTVGVSLVGIVLWGTLSGSMLPLLLKRLGLDPATSSAPFVATLVDVTGLVIYFTVALVILHGTLL
jgi:magnesium transporter